MCSRRLSVLLLVLACGLTAALPPATAQSVESIVEEMRLQYEEQLETVDNYVVETDMYTAYHRKTIQDGRPTFETVTQTSEETILSEMDTSPTASTAMDPAFFDRLASHATYAGTETVNGVESHVLQVDEPAALYEDANQEDLREGMYYVDVDDYVFSRIRMVAPQDDPNRKDRTFTIDFSDYQTTDGVTVPHTMTMQMDLNLSEEERRQMEKMRRKLEQMSEQQREQMKRMMGDQFEQMQQMIQGEPTTIEVQSVRVNEGIPDGIFSDSGSGQ